MTDLLTTLAMLAGPTVAACWGLSWLDRRSARKQAAEAAAWWDGREWATHCDLATLLSREDHSC